MRADGARLREAGTSGEWLIGGTGGAGRKAFQCHPERASVLQRDTWGPGRSAPRGSERALARNLRRIETQMRLGAHLRGAAAVHRLEANCTSALVSPQQTGSNSSTTARVRRGRRARSEKIIGRRADCIRTRISSMRHIVSTRCTVALLHQSARQHGRRVFFKLLIQQRADLLSQICSMGQPGEFIALQRIFRSGKQELPRLWVENRTKGNLPAGIGILVVI